MRIIAVIAAVTLSSCALFEEADSVDRFDAGTLDVGVDSPDMQLEDSGGSNTSTPDAGEPTDVGTDASEESDLGLPEDVRFDDWAPVAFISFDGVNAGAFDVRSEAITRSCVIDGEVSATPGLVGNAGTFEGGNCWIAHEMPWELAAGTMIIWIRPTFDMDAQAILSKGAQNATGWSLFDAGGFFTVNVKDGEGAGHSVSPMIPANAWTMLGLTWSDTGVSLWVNGERRASHPTLMPWAGNKEFLTFGADSTFSEPGERLPNYNAFSGQIDEFWIFDRELSAIEVLDFKAATEARMN